MKYFLFFFIFLFCMNIASASDIAQFVFTTNPQTIQPNEISEKLTVQAQDTSGNPVSSHPTACLELTTTSNTGQFSASSTSWGSVGKLMLTMNNNWANRNFYYKDSTAGNYTLTVKAALVSCSNWTEEGVQWTAEQNIIVSDIAEPATSDLVATESIEPTPGVGSQSWPVEPQIYANAGEDKTAVVGADIKFSGQTLGLQKEPLENARYIWNFGDGASKEGQNVLHNYQFPGNYIVVLNVSSGKYSASDRLNIRIIENNLKIITAGQDCIKLHNGSSSELDISNWFLRCGSGLFKFPESTLIKANSDLPISSSISGFSVMPGQTVDLLYSNGSVAYSYSLDVGHDVGHSVSNIVSNIAVVEPKPITKENISPAASSTSENQLASAKSVGQNNSWNPKQWLAIILGISILAGGGLILVRSKSSL